MVEATISRAGLIAELQAMFPADRVLVDAAELFVYESDGFTIAHNRPAAVVFPLTTDEVVAVVRVLVKYEAQIVPRGSGTGLAGGCVAYNAGVVVSTAKMNRVLKIDLANRVAHVEAGCRNLALSDAVAAMPLEGAGPGTAGNPYHFAPDPSSQRASSIGGNASTNAGGIHTLKDFVSSNHILGFEIVLPDATVIQIGAKDGCYESPGGIDLPGLICGHEGTFGIITKLWVRLVPKASSFRTMVAVFNTTADACNTVSQVIAAGVLPAAMEMMDGTMIKLVEDAFHFGFPSTAQALVLIEIDGIDALLDAQLDDIVQLCKRNNAASTELSKDPDRRAALWKARKGAFGAIGRVSHSYCTQDACVPRSMLAEVLKRIDQIGREHGIAITNVFHAGDGNVHPIFMYDERDEQQVQNVLMAAEKALKYCIDVGGTVTGEHGVGVEKLHIMPYQFDRPTMDQFQAVKHAFDPDERINAGKLLPSDKVTVNLLKPGRKVPQYNGSAIMIARSSSVAVVFTVCFVSTLARAGGPLINLDADSPYYPHRTYPKLTTPQWVGEEGVDAVVILAIDDMRDHRRYETVLRPILDRLKQIDGRAPVSIMTCKIDPATLLLQQWLKEGLSLEVHTIDHPCPMLAGNDFAKAKSTYDRCVDQLFAIPNNVPVAFRTPCCDSLNTPSPRLFAEIFNKTTADGHFLSIDSSVFNITTANDPALPREIAFDAPGRERFRKYVPFESFVNTIEDYPYPYIIGRACWEFPCATPSDWQAQSLHKPANPQTTQDWKALLDATVLKQGVMTMVFHPYGWSTPQQFVELIDHAAKTYGKRVKFLTFREAHERLTKNLSNGLPLRAKDGNENGIRLIDLNQDGFLDVVMTRQEQARIWDPKNRAWTPASYPKTMERAEVLVPDGSQGYLCDIDKDGQSELIVGDTVFAWDKSNSVWIPLPFALPAGTSIERGGFLADVDEDGFLDLIFSDVQRSALYLFESMKTGWKRKVFDNQRDNANAKPHLPPIVRPDGTNNGMWVHSRTLWWQNEDTAKLPNLVDRRTFNDLLKDVEPTAKSPAASLACIHVTPGYKVELVASEPLVQDPIAFSFGPDGKLWVVEMPEYPLGIDAKGTPGGRIKYLEDTDGDGVYDKVTLFLENVPFPTSVLPWKKGVLITAAPDIFYAEDTDGDGKADKREILFTSFKEGNQQHRLNHLSFGLDNWIYGANGDSGGNVKSLKTGKIVSISGRDFRFKPDAGEFEAVAGGSQFGRSRSDAGDWFGCNNSNPLWHFPLEESYLKRNPYVPPAAGTLRVDVPAIPGAAPVFATSRLLPRFNDFHTANHFTSACSAHVYRDDLFLKSDSSFILQHSSFPVFISEPVHNLVHREILTPAGVTFTGARAPAEQTSEFLSSSDNWFRPTTVATGPDGALYVADMYRQIIEHPQWIPKETQAKYDLRAGRDKGRIYRVVPVGAARGPIPRLDTLDAAGLVAALDSRSGWQRDMGQAMLLWRNDAAAVAPLEKLARESMNPLARLHAICTLDGLSKLKPESLAAALSDPDAIVRRHAVRLCDGRLAQSADLAAALTKVTDESDPHVRLQLAYTLGDWDDPRAAKMLAHLAADAASDRFLLSAVLSSLNERNIKPVAAAVTTAAEQHPPSPALLAGLFRTALGTSNSQAIASTLLSLTTARDGGHYAPWQFQTVANLLDSLDESKLSLAKLAKADAAIAPAAQRVDAVIHTARALAGDPAAPLEARAAAIGLLARDSADRKTDMASLKQLLSPQSPREIQAAIITTLSRRPDADGARLLLEQWKSLTPDLRATAVDGLLTRPDRAALLLDAVEAKSILVTEIDAPRRQRLLQFPDKTVRTRAAALLAATINPDRQKVINAFAAALTLKGDAKNGQALFAKTCATCHRLADTGNAVGPDLASVGDKSPEGLLIAILDPNRAVEALYVNYIVTTTDDQTLTGLLASESATSITLLGPDGKQQTLRRHDLKDLRSSNMSLMPEGLEAGLKPQDLADLIAFVRAGR